AAVDTSLAMATADRYRSEPFYDSLLTSVVRTVARRAPEEAARLLGPSFPSMAVMGISGGWARLDRVAASAWAIALPEEQARSTAVIRFDRGAVRCREKSSSRYNRRRCAQAFAVTNGRGRASCAGIRRMAHCPSKGPARDRGGR